MRAKSASMNDDLGLAKDFSAALRIPCLPAYSPAAPTPAGMLLPLRPHQARALHRCLCLQNALL